MKKIIRLILILTLMCLSFLLGKSYIIFSTSRKENDEKDIVEEPIIIENDENFNEYNENKENKNQNELNLQGSEDTNSNKKQEQIKEEFQINDSTNNYVEDNLIDNSNIYSNEQNNTDFTEHKNTYDDENNNIIEEQTLNFEDETSNISNNFEENENTVESGDIVPENNNVIEEQ